MPGGIQARRHGEKAEPAQPRERHRLVMFPVNVQASGELLWIGLGFVAFLVVAFVALLFWPRQLNAGQIAIIRFLAALCAGFAGGLLTGGALLTWTAVGTFGNVTLSAVGGFAAFFGIWATFPNIPAHQARTDGPVEIDIPNGFTFRSAIDMIAKQDKTIALFNNFTDAQLASCVPSRN